MRSVCRRRNDCSTCFAICSRFRPFSPPIAMPTLVASTTRSRLPPRASQRPMTVSDSPPWCPGTHDVAPASDAGVWFTAQASGHLGWLDPAKGNVDLVALGMGSAPHGVVQGPDKAAWITDGGQQAIVRVGWPDREVRKFPLPEG